MWLASLPRPCPLAPSQPRPFYLRQSNFIAQLTLINLGPCHSGSLRIFMCLAPPRPASPPLAMCRIRNMPNTSPDLKPEAKAESESESESESELKLKLRLNPKLNSKLNPNMSPELGRVLRRLKDAFVRILHKSNSINNNNNNSTCLCVCVCVCANK